METDSNKELANILTSGGGVKIAKKMRSNVVWTLFSTILISEFFVKDLFLFFASGIHAADHADPFSHRFMLTELRFHLLSQGVILLGMLVSCLNRRDWRAMTLLSASCILLGQLLQALLSGAHVIASTIVIRTPTSDSHWLDFVASETTSPLMACLKEPSLMMIVGDNGTSSCHSSCWMQGRTTLTFRPDRRTYPIFIFGSELMAWSVIMRSGLLFSAFRIPGRVGKALQSLFVFLPGAVFAVLCSWTPAIGAVGSLGRFVSPDDALHVSESVWRPFLRVCHLAFAPFFLIEAFVAFYLQHDLKERLLSVGELLRADVVNMREFMRKFTHISRTALTTIIPFSERLDDAITRLFPHSSPARKEAIENLATLRLSAQLTANMVEQLVEEYRRQAKLESGSIKWTNLPKLVESLVFGLRKKAKEDVELNAVVFPSASLFPLLQVDQTTIHRVLMNLVTNSLRHTDEGVVRVSLSASVNPERDSTDVLIVVRDTGVGMSEGRLTILNKRASERARRLLDDKTLFRRFCGVTKFAVSSPTARPYYRPSSILSLGVGLEIVHDLLQGIDGSLLFKSLPGIGTTAVVSFRCMWKVPDPSVPSSLPSSPFTEALEEDRNDLLTQSPLPKKKKEEEEEDEKHQAPTGLFPERLQLVIAEDSALNIMIFRLFLKKLGYEEGDFDIFVNGGLALEYLEGLKEIPPNLCILTDVNMPVMGGHEFTARVRANRRLSHLPIYAVTATISANTDAYCTRFLLDGRLDKPFQLPELGNLLDEAARKIMDRPADVEQEVEEDESSDAAPSDKEEIVVALDEGDDVGDSIDLMCPEAEMRIFGVRLRDTRILDASSLSAGLKQLVVRAVACVVVWTLFPEAVLLSWLTVGFFGVNVIVRFLVFVYRDGLASFEVLGLLLSATVAAFLSGSETGFGVSMVFCSFQAAAMTPRLSEVIVLSLATFVAVSVTEFVGERFFSFDGMLGWVAITAVFSTLHFSEGSIDFANRNAGENERLHTVVSEFSTRKISQECFVRRAAHDITNSLAGIRPTLLALHDMTRDSPKLSVVMPLYRQIDKAFHFISSGSSQLVEYFRLKSNRMHLIHSKWNLREFVEATLKSVTRFSERLALGTTLRVRNMIQDNVWVMIDDRRLGAILQNLMTNAGRHSTTAVSVTVQYHDDEFRCVVEDSGIGMDEREIQSLFDDPFQGKNRHHIDPSLSVGFRLFVDRELALLMGGDLTITSPGLGGGTIASLTAKLTPTTPKEERMVSAVGNRGTVVVIDDCPVAERVLIQDVKMWSRQAEQEFDVTSYRSTKSVRTAVANGDLTLSTCYCAFVDCHLGSGMNDGILLARELKSLPDSPLIVPMTADQEVIPALKKTFSVVVMKPFKRVEIMEALRNAAAEQN